MREIEFRGKRKDNGEWVCGNLVIDEDKYYICLQVNDHIKRDDYEVYMIEVIPETVGQYTGLKDKNGVKIYEGDIVKIDNSVALTFGIENIGIIKYIDGVFVVYADEKTSAIISSLYVLKDIERTLRGEIIGNIHDNPELLER